MDRLIQLNIKQVFFLPGGGAMHLNDALAAKPELEPVVCLHEQACGIAAEAAGKFTSGPAACLVTCGPGATNAITAVLGAWLDSTPVFFISGQVKTSDLKKGTELRMLGVQEVDIVTLVQSVTKMAVTLTDPQNVGRIFDELEDAALKGRKGPVWLDIPLDVQAMEIDPTNLPRLPKHDCKKLTPPQEQVQATLEILGNARRPLILAGNGVRNAHANHELLEFAELAGIPLQTSWLGMDLIGDEHPLFAGRPGSIAPRWANFALQNSDCLLVIGCRLDMALTAYAHDRFARGAVKIMVDIDRAEIQKMRTEITVPIVSDAREFLKAALEKLRGNNKMPCYKSWINQISEWKKNYPLLQPEHYKTQGPLSLYRFTDILSNLLGVNDIIAPGSAGFCVELFLLVLRVKFGQRCFHNRGTGSMGFGLPAAIGACVASGKKRTICVEGDGGFQMNVQELATMASKVLPIKCFVVNNGGYASIRSSQQNYFKRQIGADENSGLNLPNLEKICNAYGVKYQLIENGDDLQGKITEVLVQDGPIICEVLVLREEPRIPRVASKQLKDGRMVSSPLEDLYPFLEREELKKNMFIPLLDQ